MNTHCKGPAAGRRGHLSLVPGAATRPAARVEPTPPPAPTARERRVMARAGARLRRSARGLPEDSALRSELLATAECFELGADPAAEYVDVADKRRARAS